MDNENADPNSTDHKDIITQALKRFAMCEDAERDNRKRGLDADKFSIGQQWPDVVKADREADSRPCLVLNQVPKFLRTVTNEMRMNRPGIKVSPTDTQYITTADVKEGMIRMILVKSDADIAFDIATDSQVRKGFGYFRILTEYCGDDTFDQDIKVGAIKNAFTVYLDPAAVEACSQDGKFAFVTNDLDKNEYKMAYPKSAIVSQNLETLGDSAPEWMGSDYVRVAEYWVVESTPSEIYLLENGKVVDKKPKKGKILKSRTVQNKKIKMYLINGIEVLEEKEWAGKYIPIIPVWGEDIIIDGKRILKGMTEDMMDAQRQYNYWSSAATEAIALAPKAPFVMAEGQQTGYEDQWQQANVKNYPYLLYSPITINGQLAPPPQRQVAEPPVQAMSQAIRQAADDMRGTTGIFNDNLGQPSNAVSGKAVLAKQNQGDIATFHYSDNFKRAVKFLGVQLNDLIPKIYDSARIINIIHEDGTHEPMPINQKFKKGNNTLHYDLSQGEYEVVIDAGPNYATKRQQTVDQITQLAQAYPPLLTVAGDVLVKNLDWPGAQQIAARLKLMLPPQIKAAVDQEDQGAGQIPPEIQQEIMQMHEIIQKGQAALQEMQQALASKQGEENNKAAELSLKNKDLSIKAINAKIDLMTKVPTHSGGFDDILQQIDNVADTGAPPAQIAAQQQARAGQQTQKLQHTSDIQRNQHAHDAAMLSAQEVLQKQKQKHEQDMTQAQGQIAMATQQSHDARHTELMNGLGQIVHSVVGLTNTIKSPTKAVYENGKLVGTQKETVQ